MSTTIPGTIQAEDFDTGGEGVAYHDLDTTNNGGQYRTTEGVDIKTATDMGGGYAVGWIQAGEWMQYTVTVASTGTYTLSARVATPSTGESFHIEIDGINVTGSIPVPVTGAFDTTWATVEKPNINLAAGAHTLRFVAETDWFDVNYFTWTTASTPPRRPSPQP